MVSENLAAWLPKDLRLKFKPALVRMGYYSRPLFLILGGVKCGSTALHQYLSDHPRIVPAWDKEIHYFDQDSAYLDRGEDWYHSRFPPPFRLGQGKITFEATPNYLHHYTRCAERIHAYNPNLKLIALVRDPVARAYSFWNMLRAFAEEEGRSVLGQADRLDASVQDECRKLLTQPLPPFEDLVRRELETIDDADDAERELSFIRPGLYARQIEHYLKYFDREQLLILKTGKLLQETRKKLDQVVEFLGLPKYEWSAYRLQKVNAYPYQSEMSDAIRHELREFYRPHNERLYDLLGVDFGW